MKWETLPAEIVNVALASFGSLYAIADISVVKSLAGSGLFLAAWTVASIASRSLRSYVDRRKARQAILRAWANR